MERSRRITANLPAGLLEEAREVSGLGITETLVEGLKLLKRSSAARKAARLKGKLHLHLDIDTLRERPHH